VSDKTTFMVRLALVVIALISIAQSRGAAATHIWGTIGANTTWTVAGSPYIVSYGLIVAEGATLTIEPGVVVKVNGTFTTIIIRGSLNAIGTGANRIIFTSIQDDSVGGDSGNDGATSGAPGQWWYLGVNGSAVLKYVDVRYGGYGSANHAYGAFLSGNGGANAVVDIDYSRFLFNQRSGLYAATGSSTTIAHSEFTQNGNGISVQHGATIQIGANSKLSSNSDTGLWMNYLSTYTGIAPSITNSEIFNNLNYGVNLQVDYGMPAASLPVGHGNNIFNNGNGSDMRQLHSHFPLPDSDWSDNYWGPIVGAISCPFAPPSTTQIHLTYDVPIGGYCQDPGLGPTRYSVFQQPGGCPNLQPARCASDFVKNTPYSSTPIDNSGW
jgi:hypothetical protein